MERFSGLLARGGGVARCRGLVARRGLLERAIGIRLAGFAAIPLERRSGFQSAFLMIAVRLIGVGAFFSVFGGLGNCIYVLLLTGALAMLKMRVAGRMMWRKRNSCNGYSGTGI